MWAVESPKVHVAVLGQPRRYRHSCHVTNATQHPDDSENSAPKRTRRVSRYTIAVAFIFVVMFGLSAVVVFALVQDGALRM